MTVSLLWFRRDLRTCDHPALQAAVDAGTSVLPVFVLDPRLLVPDGPRSRRLVASVRALARPLDGRLVVRTGDPVEVIPGLAREVGAEQGPRDQGDDALRAPKRRCGCVELVR